MGSSWTRTATCLVVAVACTSTGAPDPSPLPAWPDTVAAIGDSVTTATVPDLDHLSADNPNLSWATGGEEVASHRARIAQQHPRVTASNVAVPGARIADARAQADQVVAAGADYVVFLLGSNDVCATDPPTAERFETDTRDALRRLETGLPDAYVFVVSIPDVVHLRQVFSGNARAQAVWQRTAACPAVLAPGMAESDLAAVGDLRTTYNRILRDVCDRHPRCRHDAGRIARHRFSSSEVSTADFFHPSIAGQRRLAELTWRIAFTDAP